MIIPPAAASPGLRSHPEPSPGRLTRDARCLSSASATSASDSLNPRGDLLPFECNEKSIKVHVARRRLTGESMHGPGSALSARPRGRIYSSWPGAGEIRDPRMEHHCHASRSTGRTVQGFISRHSP